MIYLDNAATTEKKPENVITAVNRALREYSANPGRSGHSASEKAAVAVYSAREKAAKMFGADGAENVVFTPGCTHSINSVLKGVLRSGEHIIISSLEHNSVLRPLHSLNAKVSEAAVSLTDDNITVENFRRLIQPDTRLIFVTGASNVIGKCLPVTEIGRLCHENGILFGVDAAQTAGVIPIDMKRDNIDYLCIAPHKGLYAPMGIGIMIARGKIPYTIIEGGTGTDSASLLQPESLPERLESGTLNVPGIIGTAAGIDFVNRNGIENIHRHEMRIIRRIYRALEKMPNIALYTPIPEQHGWTALLPFNIKGIPSYEATEKLNRLGIAARAGLHCAPGAHRQIGTDEYGAVRICPSVFTSENEADYFIYRLRQLQSN